MKALYAGLSAGVVLSVCATTSASAMIGPTVASALALQRAQALVSVPNLSARHTFTIMTRSKADKDVAAVAAYFEQYGMTVKTLAHTKNLQVSGTFTQASRAGHTTLQTLRLHNEAVVRTTQRPTFPANIAALISGTSFSPGLHFKPLSVISAPRVQSFFGPAATGYTPADIASIYNINPVYNAGDTGSGVNVAIAACTDTTVSDVTAFGNDFHLPALHLVKKFIDGPAPTGVDGEAILDVERVYATAPGATIYEYLAPDCTDAELVDVFTQIAEDSATYHFSGASFSYGENESQYAADGVVADLLDESAAIAELSAAGVPLFASSGDTGAWNNEFQPDVSYPASDTNAIAVGGTTVLETTVRNRLSETGWTGSGGGISSVFSIPSYQSRFPGMASYVYKNIPDVSMLADPYTGVAMNAPDVFGVTGEVPIGGTSVSAPTFNGVWALVNSARHAYGRANVTGAAAAIYASSHDFYDVSVGDNGAYNAKPGYDNMTGLGAPDVTRLVLDMLRV
jgi:kumamolisin